MAITMKKDNEVTSISKNTNLNVFAGSQVPSGRSP